MSRQGEIGAGAEIVVFSITPIWLLLFTLPSIPNFLETTFFRIKIPLSSSRLFERRYIHFFLSKSPGPIKNPPNAETLFETETIDSDFIVREPEVRSFPKMPN